MAERERLPDEAIVVRCGLPPFRNSPLVKGCRRHPEGVFGFSVHASAQQTVEQLASFCFSKSVGFTTVGEIRTMGYDVIATSGGPWHATVVVPQNWTDEAADELARLFQQLKNPSPKRRP